MKAAWFGRSMGLVFVVVTMAIGGCGGGSSSSGLCSKWVQATCDKLFTCAEASDMARSDAGGSKANCITGDTAFLCAGGDACPSGKTYHPDKAQQCIDQTSSAVCATSFDSDGYFTDPAACSQVCT